MCEINAKHKRFFRLEVFTSNPSVSAEEFEAVVAERLLAAEMQLNGDGVIRAHIHEEEDKAGE